MKLSRRDSFTRDHLTVDDADRRRFRDDDGEPAVGLAPAHPRGDGQRAIERDWPESGPRPRRAAATAPRARRPRRRRRGGLGCRRPWPECRRGAGRHKVSKLHAPSRRRAWRRRRGVRLTRERSLLVVIMRLPRCRPVWTASQPDWARRRACSSSSRAARCTAERPSRISSQRQRSRPLRPTPRRLRTLAITGRKRRVPVPFATVSGLLMDPGDPK